MGFAGSMLIFSRDLRAEMAARQCRRRFSFSFLTCMLSVIPIMEIGQIPTDRLEAGKEFGE